jgi:hypothetical protein
MLSADCLVEDLHVVVPRKLCNLGKLAGRGLGVGRETRDGNLVESIGLCLSGRGHDKKKRKENDEDFS